MDPVNNACIVGPGAMHATSVASSIFSFSQSFRVQVEFYFIFLLISFSWENS